MDDRSSTATPSRLSLRRLLLGFWLLSSSLLASTLLFLDVLERYREVYFDAEHARNVVLATFLSKSAESSRQPLIQAYASIPHSNGLEGMNFLLVTDRFGHIQYSSRPHWLGLNLTDPLFNRSETNDPVFRGLVDCLVETPKDCISFHAPPNRLSLESYSVVLPIELPAEDLGLNRREMLLVVNYAPSVILADVGHDLLAVVLACFAGIGLITIGFAFFFSSSLLPQLDEVSRTDALTSLINRGLFMDQVKVLLADAEENLIDLVFVVADIDHFKNINDAYGHVCGDMALAHVAQLFTSTTRPEDVVCRFGGEEFAMVIHGSRDAAGRALERLRLQIELVHLDYSGHRVKVTASFGAASTVDCGYNVDYLYSCADKALYSAKQAGRNRIAWSDGFVASRLSL